MAFSMTTLSSWVEILMPKLGTGGNMMAPEVGAVAGQLARVANNGVVEGLGAAAPVPPPPGTTL